MMADQRFGELLDRTFDRASYRMFDTLFDRLGASDRMFDGMFDRASYRMFDTMFDRATR